MWCMEVPSKKELDFKIIYSEREVTPKIARPGDWGNW